MFMIYWLGYLVRTRKYEAESQTTQELKQAITFQIGQIPRDKKNVPEWQRILPGGYKCVDSVVGDI